MVDYDEAIRKRVKVITSLMSRTVRPDINTYHDGGKELWECHREIESLQATQRLVT
jgi:hypothetical protein